MDATEAQAQPQVQTQVQPQPEIQPQQQQPAKRGRGRPKGSLNKNKRPPQPKVTVRELPLPNYNDDNDYSDQQAGHINHHRTELDDHVNDLQDSWETESLFEDALSDLADERFFDQVEDACTPTEQGYYRKRLRKVGPERLVAETVNAGTVTARKLITAFGARPPPFLEGAEDEEYLSFLSLVMLRELKKRAKLYEYNTVDDAAQLIRNSKNIMVITGAGVSTSLGIPDFRSDGTGLYHKLRDLGLPINDPQEVFHIDVFKDDPSIFFTVAKDILPAIQKYTPTHAFIARLQDEGKLLTNYSQNIDNIEAIAGIRPDKLVQCHGSFATATCQKCGYKVAGDTIFGDIKAGLIPRCQRCIVALRANGNMKRKRSYNSSSRNNSRRRGRNSSDDSDEEDSDFPAAGIMKPDITFFGEALPQAFHHRLIQHDRDAVDLVIVIGTSLKVAPVSEIVPFIYSHVPQIYISKTPVGHTNFDIDLIGECDVVVANLCRRLNWDLGHEMIDPNERVHIETAEGFESRHIFTRGQIISGPSPQRVAPRREPDYDPIESGSLERVD